MKRQLLLWLGMLMGAVVSLVAEEIWLHDNTRIYGLVKGVVNETALQILLPTGEVKTVPLEEIIAVTFLGRNPLLIQSGTQEFRFLDGSRLRGQILSSEGDKVKVETALAGDVDLELQHLRGFVSLPMIGFSSLKAEELIESQTTKERQYYDMIVDRRGSVYWGVLRKFERTALYLDIDDLLEVRPIKILYLKGVRLAGAARGQEKPWGGSLLGCVRCRDGSELRGRLSEIRFNRWYLRASWDPKLILPIALDEISQVQTMGGYVQYLSQLQPVEVNEKTILAPPQPYQMNRSCQKESLSIAGKRYPWGIGVHADSELTFLINARYREFRSDIGLSTSVGNRGSVVFEVLGDGKSLYKSPLVRGSDGKALSISVPVEGVKKLTLRVTNGGDLDLGDVANWGSARLLRVPPRSP
ncbi:MAG: NPCBM/NEW2 domain-containing protein [Kiritimatiellae bacterium]|nr:NPCBM/NEW2 domain-containing protein [Kiritimatiellia bacterium]